MLLKPHLTGPLNVQRRSIICWHSRFVGDNANIRGKEEVFHTVRCLSHSNSSIVRPGLSAEVLVVEREGAEGAILVVTASRELHGQHRLRREVAAKRKAVVLGAGN